MKNQSSRSLISLPILQGTAGASFWRTNADADPAESL